MFEVDQITHEYCFWGNRVHGFWDTDSDPAWENKSEHLESKHHCQFHRIVDGKPWSSSIEYHLTQTMFEGICQMIESGNENVYLEDDGCLYRRLKKMPTDKNGIRFTGYEYLEVNGDWVLEDETDERTGVLEKF